MENEYSVNLPTKFVYQGKEWDGWINVVNVFRASIVLGTPGSGKSYAVVNNYIKQMISKAIRFYICTITNLMTSRSLPITNCLKTLTSTG